ncbi:CdaR family protein [Salegentibacter chungangensis]|uniref:CdaR family protein n=1 Tax=Salegentibacter chungangensis TaxID=1335724 RepID=A0ABW3NRN2_9FLAO
MSQKQGNRSIGFKKGNLKTFSFFLIFSAVIWVFVQFSKEYTQVVQIPVKYVNAPLDKSISEDKPRFLELRLQDNGFVIFWDFKIFKPSLSIDLSTALEKNGQLIYVLENHRDTIAEQLGIDFEKSRFLTDEIVIDFQLKKEKKIAVIPQTELSYAVGYSAGERVSIDPDSIKVSGPENVIDTISRVKTLPLILNNISKDLSGEIALDTTNLGMLSFYKNKVKYSQKVEKFTEGKMKIDVEVLNVPPEINLVIFPKEVVVYYQVNLEDYEKVNASDFEVICDYASLQRGDDFMIAEIVKKPDYVNNLRLNERKIQFIIKR